MVSAMEANMCLQSLLRSWLIQTSQDLSRVRLTVLTYLEWATNRMTEHRQATFFFYTSFGGMGIAGMRLGENFYLLILS